MITGKDIYVEIKNLEKAYNLPGISEAEKAIIKGLILNLKVAHNNRSNSTLIMKHLDIPLAKPENEEYAENKK